jgi:hypothetical protein
MMSLTQIYAQLLGPVSLLMLLAGCQTVITSVASKRAENPAAVTEFESRIAKSGSVTFRSWSGRALRSDNDTELTFLLNNAVHMFQWGLALRSFTGTYALEPGGRVTLEFKGYEKKWPHMVLDQALGSLELEPEEPQKNDEWLGYWTFRMLAGDDEENVLKMLREWPKS